MFLWPFFNVSWLYKKVSLSSHVLNFQSFCFTPIKWKYILIFIKKSTETFQLCGKFVKIAEFFRKGCLWQGRPCQLVVHHEEGFTLYSAGSRALSGIGSNSNSLPTSLWQRPFEKLKMSADDGARLLWLDFGEEDGEIVSLQKYFIPQYFFKINQYYTDDAGFKWI